MMYLIHRVKRNLTSSWCAVSLLCWSYIACCECWSHTLGENTSRRHVNELLFVGGQTNNVVEVHRRVGEISDPLRLDHDVVLNMEQGKERYVYHNPFHLKERKKTVSIDIDTKTVVRKKTVSIDIDTKTVVRETDTNFLSVAIDSGLIKEDAWKKFDFTSERLKTLAKGVSPCYLRVGGTEQDFLFFNESVYENNHKNFTNFTMTVEDWDNINEFAMEVGWKVIFGLNVLIRHGNDTWDPSNAMELINYTVKKGYSVNWELGNEPNSFRVTVGRALDASVLAQDFITLRNILNARKELRHNLLIGPDVNDIEKKKPNKYLDSFLQSSNNVTNATTWHQYYIDGKTAKVDDFINPHILNDLIGLIQRVNETVDEHRPGSSVWLGETSSAYGGGAPNLSDSYVAGFMWLDKLGISSLYGIDVVIRQTFFHGHYAMIDDDLNPLPDYWLSVLYKRLVGSKVLSVTLDDYSVNPKTKRVRIYAHCSINSSDYPHGSITIYALSLHTKHNTAIFLPSAFSEVSVDEYLLSPHGRRHLTARTVDLNGVALKMMNNHTLPELTPRHIHPGESLILPPLSFAFYVIPNAMAEACL